jgi:hypothetical protein
MTHAFRDAEFVANEIGGALRATKSDSEAGAAYRERRYLDSFKYFEFVCSQAEMNPARPDELQLFEAMSGDQDAVERLLAVFGDTLSPSAVFSHENTKRWLARTNETASSYLDYMRKMGSYYQNIFAKARGAGKRREALSRTSVDFAQPVGPCLQKRTESYFDWCTIRNETETWQFARTLKTGPGPTAAIVDDYGRGVDGVNFASQDYLALTSHPAIREAAIKALVDFGPHSAGSPMVIGNTSLSQALERELADFLGTEHILLFPTGWAAGFGAIAALVRPHDHVVMDKLSHACLQQGAFAASRNVHRHPESPGGVS